jgi:hypothetical protein
MPIPPGYAPVRVERIYQPDFEDLKIDIPGGDGEKTLKDALHDIILWPKRYIIIIPENDGSPSRPGNGLRSKSNLRKSNKSPTTNTPHPIQSYQLV